MRRSSRGTGPLISTLISLLRIAVPLIVIAAGALWLLSNKSAPTGTLRVTSTIPGADIYIAGVQTGFVTDTVLTNVDAGRQVITIRKPGYTSNPEVVIVEVFEERLSNASFELMDARETTRTDSLPPSAAVRQHIFSTGEPKISIPPAPPRRAMVVYEDDSPTDYSYEPTQRPRRTVSQQLPAANDSPRRSLSDTRITISSVPDGAEILVNSAETPHVTPYTFQGLDRGVYVFSLQKEGYDVQPSEISVSLVQDAQSELVAFHLKPNASWPKPVATISTEPLAARIYIDNVPVGVGQVSLELDFGKHVVEFADVAGYRTPEAISFEFTPDDASSEFVAAYERITGNAFLAVVPGSGINPFDGTQLRIYVDNELILDGHEEPYDLTLVGSLLPGKRLVRIEYGSLSNDIHVDLSDGDVAEVRFRLESFFSKRSLKLRERRELPLEKWQSRHKKSNILSLS